MAGQSLAGRSVLVVEDEYVIALEMQRALADEGAEILGPVASVQGALELIDRCSRVDVAILDINLHGEPAYPVAKELRRKGVPFVFTTGYGAASVPKEFSTVRLIEKPIDPQQIARTLLS